MDRSMESSRSVRSCCLFALGVSGTMGESSVPS